MTIYVTEAESTSYKSDPKQLAEMDNLMEQAAQENSPFIPGTKLQYAWDATSLTWLKECPRKYQYCMIEGYQSKMRSIDLDFGILYHEGIAVYERAKLCGESHINALRETVLYALQQSKGWSNEDPNKNRETLIRSLIWYLEEFQIDNARTIELANGRPAVELSFRMHLGFGPPVQSKFERPGYMLCGHIDRLVEFTGQQFVMDHKTTKYTLSPSYFQGYEPNNQMSLYTIASKVVFASPIKGVIIDAAQVAVGFTRFERGVTFRTEGQIAEWLEDLQLLLIKNEQYVFEDYWPMNDTACRICQFRKICSKDPSVRQHFLDSEFERRPWNPLIPR